MWHPDLFDLSRIARTCSSADHRKAVGSHDRATLPERQSRAAAEQRARYWLARLDAESREWLTVLAANNSSPLEAANEKQRASDDAERNCRR